MLPATLQTARLTLRPVAAADEAAVVGAISDLAVAGWLATVPHPYSVADFRHFLREIAQPGATFVIDDPAGFAGILGLEDGELGYWLAPRAQGLGYATEACRCVLAAHFASGGDSVVSGHFDGNTPSARVLAKLGFIETGLRLRSCAALGSDRPHYDLVLTRGAFEKASR